LTLPPPREVERPERDRERCCFVDTDIVSARGAAIVFWMVRVGFVCVVWQSLLMLTELIDGGMVIILKPSFGVCGFRA